MKILLITILLLIANMAPSFSGTRDPNVQDAKYITYGSDFTCIAKIIGKTSNGQSFSASAVAIDDNHIITAAHVVENVETCKVILANKEYVISEITINKKFDMHKYGTGDIAIGYSIEKFKLNFYPKLYTNNDERNKVCSISGYGFTGTFVTGAKIYDDNKRAGSNMIDSIDKDLLICSPSKKGQKGYTTLEFLIASGDSGGGLFIDGKLAGINSCVIALNKTPKSVYGDQSGHTRISNYVEWIDRIRQKKRIDTEHP
jgi:S1-C subfamily serine protease